MMGILPDFDTRKAEFYCSRQFYYQVMVPFLTAGNNTIGDLQRADLQQEMFLSHKVNFVQGIPGTPILPIATATNTICLLYGWMDLAVKFGDRKGMIISVHDQTDTAVTNDLILVKA